MVVLPKNERRTLGEVTKRTIWVYGNPFSGKTVFADSAPEPFMLNTDGNAAYVTAPAVSIADKVKLTGRLIERTFAWDIFKEYVEELEKGQHTYKTLVLDLVNDLYELCRVRMYDKLHISHESDEPRGAWDKVRTEYLSTMRRCVNMPMENIILLSHETTFEVTERGKDKLVGYRPSMQEKVVNSVAGMVGLVGRAYAEDGKYWLTVKSDNTVFGGGRLGISNVTIPLEWDEVAKLFNTKNEKGNN